MSACPRRRFPTLAPAQHMICIWKQELRSGIWRWRGCGLRQPPSKDPSWQYSGKSAFWKIHFPLPGFLAGWLRRAQGSQFQASAWVVQVFWVVSKTIFPSGSLPSPPFPLPSPCPRSWHPLALPPSAPILTPLLQGPLQAWLGPLWHCGLLDYAEQTSQPLRTFRLRRLLAEACAISSPESTGPKPQHQAILKTVGHVGEP